MTIRSIGVAILLLACPALSAPAQPQMTPTQAGWRALRAGAVDEASDDFARALQRDGSDALALLGAGAVANIRGKSDEARQYLGGALREDPGLTSASRLLGEILYRGADLQGAIAVYEQALVFAPDDKQIASRLDTWRREAALQQTFSTRVAPHFTILFEGPPDRPAAGRVEQLLEGVYWRVGGAIGAYPPGVVTVILYSREQFRDVTQSPSWAGGAYDGRIRVPVAGRIAEAELQRVLAHEFTHAVVHDIAPRGVPQWLNEGLAVLMERGGAAPPGDRPPQPFLPLTRLEGSFDSLSPTEAREAYATSAAAAQALLDRSGPMAIYNLLSNIGNGMPFDEAFERAVFVPYRDFAREWR